MVERTKLEYDRLTGGYQFPPGQFSLDAAAVARYTEAVDDTTCARPGAVPPMLIAACALKSLSDGISLPAGAIHVSQEFSFAGTAAVGEVLTCRARVGRKVDRGRIRMLTIELDVANEQRRNVLSGSTGFVLP